MWRKGSPHRHLTEAVRWTRTALARRGIATVLEYISWISNTAAGKLSRVAQGSHEAVRMRPHLVNNISRVLRHPVKLDLFADRHNAICGKYMSLRPQPGSSGTNSMDKEFDSLGGGLWGNPPTD